MINATVDMMYSMTFRVYLGVRTCDVFLCFVAIVFLLYIVLSFLFPLFYVIGDCYRFLHRGLADL